MSEINLNTKIGELLNFPYQMQYLIMNKNEDSYWLDLDSKKEAEEWLSREQKKDSDIIRAGAHIVPRKAYPGFSSNLETARDVVNAMYEKGFWLKLYGPHPFTQINKWTAHFRKSIDWVFAESENPAEAIVLAAIKAIEENPKIFKKD